MSRFRKHGYTISREIDVDIEIELDDVLEYIESYADSGDLRAIGKALGKTGEIFENTHFIGTLENSMKNELLVLAAKKYSLTQLEDLLGSKFDLM